MKRLYLMYGLITFRVLIGLKNVMTRSPHMNPKDEHGLM